MAPNSDFLTKMNRLRKENDASCDVSFKFDDREFPAHSAVLILKIDYFREFFSNPDKKNKSILLDADCDSEIFEQVLEHIYISNIVMTAGKLERVCHLAELMHYEELLDLVGLFMNDTLNVNNVYEYMDIATVYQLCALEKCLKFIIDHSQTDEDKSGFVSSLSFENLNLLITKLKDKPEKTFQYSLDWTRYDLNCRTSRLPELLKNIPLENLGFDNLKQIASQNNLIREDKECLNLVLDALLAALDKNERKAKELVESLKLSLFRSQESLKLGLFRSQNNSIFAIGGKDGTSLSSVSEYNSTNNRWIATTPMPGPRSHFSCAVIGHKIYVCGGDTGRGVTNELTMFDTHHRTWVQLKPMKHARCHASVAVLNGQIYVVGGFHKNPLTVVEQYCVATDHWKDITPLTSLRCAFGLVALNDHLYAIGGYEDTIGTMLDIVERYNPQTGQWTRMKNTNNKYGSICSAVLNGYIYIVGRDKCEVYSPAENNWTEMPAPSRCDFGRRLVVCDGKLYAIGGLVGEWKDNVGSRTVEVYDFQARVWRSETNMDVARCWHGIAVVKS